MPALLLAPIAWGATCAVVVWAFVKMAHPATVSTSWLVGAGVVGLVATEFELLRILVGWGFDGQCSANTDIMEKVPKFRPCGISEWRVEALFPRFLSRAVWYWRIAAAIGFVAMFSALLLRRRRRLTRGT